MLSLIQTLAVAEYLNFHHAANPLGVSQSSVSARIRALEEELDIPLFERNIRRIVGDLLPFLLAFLPGIAPHHRLGFVRQPRLRYELLDLIHLTVGQCVHRINDDRTGLARLPGFPRANNRVDDRHEKAERFTRSCSCRNYVAFPRASFGDRLGLVAVKP